MHYPASFLAWMHMLLRWRVVPWLELQDVDRA